MFSARKFSRVYAGGQQVLPYKLSVETVLNVDSAVNIVFKYWFKENYSQCFFEGSGAVFLYRPRRKEVLWIILPNLFVSLDKFFG